MKTIIAKLSVLSIALMLFCVVACSKDEISETSPEPVTFETQMLTNGLNAPIGFTLDEKGQLWVAETGTGHDDAAIVMVTPDGTKTTVFGGFESKLANGAVEGMSRPLYKDGKLYILHGISGFLYWGDVSGFKKGDAAIDINTLEKQDIGTYVKSLNLTTPLNSNILHSVFGPDNNLYLVDAGANAIIKRDMITGDLSLFAAFPNVDDVSEAVPTGIVFDGQDFLVSNLSGFPFKSGNSFIYKVSTSGAISTYKSGYETLISIALTQNNKPLVLQYATFSPGFAPNSGALLNENGDVLLSALNLPTDILRFSDREFYLLSYGDGTISKLSY